MRNWVHGFLSPLSLSLSLSRFAVKDSFFLWVPLSFQWLLFSNPLCHTLCVFSQLLQLKQLTRNDTPSLQEMGNSDLITCVLWEIQRTTFHFFLHLTPSSSKKNFSTATLFYNQRSIFCWLVTFNKCQISEKKIGIV